MSFGIRLKIKQMTDLHPGPKAHKQYAERLKDVLQDRFK